MFFYRMVVEYYFTAKFAAHCTLLQELTLVGFGSGPWNTGLKQSVSPLKMKKKKRTMNQSSPYLLQILNQNHPSVHLIAREKGKKKKKKVVLCLWKDFSSAIPQTSWELPGVYLGEAQLFAEIYSKCSICLPAFSTMPTLCPELGLQHVRCTETSFHLALTRARKIWRFKLSFLPSETHMDLLP